jgi:DUF971 family protein
MKRAGHPPALFWHNTMQQPPVPLRPTSITVDKDSAQVRLAWSDGHQSAYSFEQLRAACPCAECQAYRSESDPLGRAVVVSIGLESANLVGNYAIQFSWVDGHRFGIYAWEYLRALG